MVQCGVAENARSRVCKECGAGGSAAATDWMIIEGSIL